MSRSLSRRPVNLLQRARTNALDSLLQDVAESDVAVSMAASRAAEIDSPEAGEALLTLPLEELRRLGWASREELRCAIDAKRSAKFVPFYVRMAHERTLMRYRGQEGERAGAKAVIVMPHEAPPANEEEMPALPAVEDEEK